LLTNLKQLLIGRHYVPTTASDFQRYVDTLNGKLSSASKLLAEGYSGPSKILREQIGQLSAHFASEVKKYENTPSDQDLIENCCDDLWIEIEKASRDLLSPYFKRELTN